MSRLAGIAMGVIFYAIGAVLLVPDVEPVWRRRGGPALGVPGGAG